MQERLNLSMFYSVSHEVLSFEVVFQPYHSDRNNLKLANVSFLGYYTKQQD